MYKYIDMDQGVELAYIKKVLEERKVFVITGAPVCEQKITSISVKAHIEPGIKVHSLRSNNTHEATRLFTTLLVKSRTLKFKKNTYSTRVINHQ